ncbi:MAG TPA: AIR synthase-related protein, partial [Sphingomonas sp.]|nr:AIR synthase-related protein [Sphingomonas sp.]
ARINAASWPLPRLMAFLQAQGNIEPEEMARTFNCGVGMVAVVAPDQADAIAAELAEAGETVFRIGAIEEGQRGCTVFGPAETWSARAEWSATHNG